MSTTATPAPVQSQPLSEPARLLNMFFEPGKTFADLRRSAAWWGPLLVFAAFSMAFVYTVERQVGWEQVARNNMQLNQRAAEQIERLPAEQRAQQMQSIARFTRIFSYLFPAVWLLMLLVVAGVLTGTFQFGLGAEVSYKHALAIVLYAGVPASVVRSGLAMLSLVAGAAPDGFYIQNPVATNPGYFVDAAQSPVLFALLTHLDLTMLWTLLLSALGFSVLTKVKRSTAAWVIFGWYAVFVLVMTGFAALSG